MNLSEHFTLQEATYSKTAIERGIDNTPGATMIDAIRHTAQFMEHIRDVLGHPVVVSSWYRCPALEEVIAPGKRTVGHHTLGAAVDFTCPGYGSPIEIASRLSTMTAALAIGQLIYEFGSWVHISRLPVAPINRVLTIDKRGVLVGIVP